jgi:tetratricopeptide (TPR) repeat protein
VARRLDRPIVGRARERERLRADFADVVATGACRLFTLIGEAGVGKSRLVADFLDSVAGRARVVRGRALAYGEGITYWPLVELLVQLGVEPGPVVHGASGDVRLAARAVLEHAAEEQPLVVVLDDLHWSEAPLLDLVEHLADWSRQSSIFLLCVARPELLDLRPGWGGGKLNATSLLLEALGEQESASLVDEVLGGAGLDTDVRDRILRTAEGNPLFLEELVAFARTSSGAVDVPPTIQAVLQARLDALDETERRVIDTGAVEGKVFHRGAVTALTSESLRSDVPGNLLALVRKELVRPDRTQIVGDDAYRFRHLLIRDTAYEALPKATRAELHERFADWLAEHGELLELDELVGYHLEQAVRYRLELGEPEQALDTLAGRAAARLGAAGRAAFAREDHHATRNLLGRAVALLPEGEARRRLLPDLIDALLLGHELDEVEDLLAELERGDDRDRATAVVFRPLLGFATGGAGTFAEQRADVEAARVVLEATGDEMGVVRCDRELAQLAWGLCRAEESLTAATRALEGLSAIGSTAFQSEIVRAIQVALTFTGRSAAESLASLDELLRGVGPIGPRLQASVDAARARVLFSAGEIDAEEARAVIHAEIELVQQTGAPLEAGFASSYLMVIAWLEGDDRVAEQLQGRRVAELEAFGSTAWLANPLASWAGWLCRVGETQAALDAVARAKSVAREDDIADQIEIASAEGYAWALLGDRARAQAAIERATASLATIDMTLLSNEITCRVALSYAALGDHATARALLESLIEDADRRGFRRWADRYRRDLEGVDA